MKIPYLIFVFIFFLGCRDDIPLTNPTPDTVAQSNLLDSLLPAIKIPAGYSRKDFLVDSALMARWYVDSMENYYQDGGPYDKGLIFGKKAYELTGRMLQFENRDELYLSHMINIAFTAWRFINLGSVSTGELLTQQAIDLYYQRFDDENYVLSEWMVALAYCHEVRGEYQNVETYNMKALDIIHNTLPANDYYYRNMYFNMAWNKMRVEHYPEAIHYMNQALQWTKQYGSMAFDEVAQRRSLSIIYAYLAKLYILNEQVDHAADYLQLIKQCDFTGNSWTHLGNYFFVKGYLAYKKKNYQQAQTDLIKSIFNKQDLSYKNYKSYLSNQDLLIVPTRSRNYFANDAMHLLAEIELEQKNYGSAMNWYNFSSKNYSLSAEPNFRFLIFPEQGIIKSFMLLNKLDTALHLCNQSLDRYEFYRDLETDPQQLATGKYSIEVNVLKLLQLKAEILISRYDRNPNPSIEMDIMGTITTIDQLITELIKRYDFKFSKNLLLSKSREFSDLSLAFLYRRYSETRDAKYLDKLFSIMEKSKSIILNSELDFQRAKYVSDIPNAFIDEDDNFQNQIRGLQTLLVNTAQNSIDQTKRIDLFTQLATLSQEYQLFQNDLEKNYPNYKKFKNLNSYVQLVEAQKEIEANTAVIEYHLTDSLLYILSVSKNDAQIKCISIDEDFIDSLHYFIQQLAPYTKSSVEDFQVYSHYLFQKLIGPVEHQLKVTKYLVIIPHRFIYYLPFEVLCSSATEGESASFRNLSYLINDYHIRYENSISTMKISPKPKSKIEHAYIGFAPSFDQSDRDKFAVLRDANAPYFPVLRNERILPLVYHREEVMQARQKFGGQSFISQNATESNFKQFAGHSNILHLATHAFVSDTDPTQSHLVFYQNDTSAAEDGYLYSQEIQALDLSNDLTILSACNSGNGIWSEGEGVMSLSNSFRHAGSKNLLISLKNINDESTKIIINNFFAELFKGKGKAEALNEAKRRYISSVQDGKLTHPQYWANLVLIGDDDPILPIGH